MTSKIILLNLDMVGVFLLLVLLVLITVVNPLPAGSRKQDYWPLVAGHNIGLDFAEPLAPDLEEQHREKRAALELSRTSERSTSPGNQNDDHLEPWQINQDICPPPLAHLCSIEVPAPGGGTQNAFVTPFFEGDIVLDWEERRYLGLANMQATSLRSRPHRRSRRAIIKGRDKRWPDAVIPYIIDADFNQETVKLIKSALKQWQRNTCIRFVPKKQSHRDYLRFAYFPGCWSFIGRQGGEQIISMGPGCNVYGTIVHEVGHAIGFWHEQSRRDRDMYIQVVQRNIAPGTGENFGKVDAANVTSHGYPYDFASIMHYSSNAFSTNGKPTIRVRKRYRDLLPGASERMGRHSLGLSELDIAQTRGMYRCNEKAAKRQKKEPCIESEAGDGREYRGDLDFTESGITCQRWSSQYPHQHGYYSDDETKNEKRGVGDHNFCRNPGGRRERPWCYTTLKKTTWEYCDISICPSVQ